MRSTPLNAPLLVVNFKNYPEALGRRSVELARAAERASRDTGITIAVAPPQTALMSVASSVSIPVLAQHVDDVPASSTTGYVPVESVKEAGASGSILNHSEHKLPTDVVGRLVERVRSAGLVSLVCAADPDEASALARFSPDFIAVEPPELIGSGRAVSKVAPEVVSRSVSAVKAVDHGVSVLCGAGIVSGEDAAAAAELGADGVLVASGVVRSGDPEARIRELARSLIR